MKIVNLTPHPLNLMPEGPEGPVVTIPPSGQVARCAVDRVQVDTVTVDGISIPVNQTRFGKVENLPEPQEGTIFIVSALTAQAVPEREDVFITDDAVRDEQGRIIVCQGAGPHLMISRVTGLTHYPGASPVAIS